jgi:hypothetical protein
MTMTVAQLTSLKDRVDFIQVMEKQLRAVRKKVEKEEGNQKGIHLVLHWSPGHSDMATFQERGCS